jgi:chromosome segregation ATPase
MIDEEIKKALAQLDIYKTELGKVREELARARTDKSTLAKTTLAQLESDIPRLEGEVKKNQEILSLLEKAIEEKNRKLTQQETDSRLKYEELEKVLSTNYSSKDRELEKRGIDLKNKESDFRHTCEIVEQSLKQRELHSENVERNLKKSESALKAGQDQLEAEKAAFSKEYNAKVQQIEVLKINAANSIEEAKNNVRQADESLARSKAKENEVNSILSRLDEVEKREDEVKNREELNKKRTAELNEMSVAIRADRIRLEKKEEGLNQREAKLNQREKNLKELEAKV